jgi:hypothetical protein
MSLNEEFRSLLRSKAGKIGALRSFSVGALFDTFGIVEFIDSVSYKRFIPSG